MRKIKNLQTIPSDAILVIVDVVGFYQIIPHECGLNYVKEVLDKREKKLVSTEDLLQMLGFVLENNYFKFNGQIKQKISGTATSTECAPTYV